MLLPQKDVIRWGILGTSFISEVMARALRESPTSKLVAVGSRTHLTAQSFASTFKIPKIYSDYNALLDDKDIDAVYIGLPNHLHKEWIIRAARAGKHILCEKPLVLTAADVEQIIPIIEQADVVCMEALMYLYHPFTQRLKELVDKKTIGDIKLYTATYSANIAEIANPVAGGSIRNLGCYPLSLIRFLEGKEPMEISAMGRLNSRQIDTQACIIIKFDNQCMATVSTADDMDMFWQFDIYGSKGNIKLQSNPWLPTKENSLYVYPDNEKKPVECSISAYHSLYTYQIEELNKQISTNTIAHFNASAVHNSLGNALIIERWINELSTSEQCLA